MWSIESRMVSSEALETMAPDGCLYYSAGVAEPIAGSQDASAYRPRKGKTNLAIT
jgi:hypothetical protein